MPDLLSERYALSVLTKVFELQSTRHPRIYNNQNTDGNVMKKDLSEIVKSSSTLNTLLKILEKNGFIEIKEDNIGRKIFFISLTDKGREVVERLPKTNTELKEVEDEPHAVDINPDELLHHRNFLQSIKTSSGAKPAQETVKVVTFHIIIDISLKEEDRGRIAELLKIMKDWHNKNPDVQFTSSFQGP